MSIKVDLSKAGEISSDVYADVEAGFDKVVGGTGEGNDALGWRDLPVQYDKEEYARIKTAADYIRNNAEIFIVIGIGGSYLGARAVMEGMDDVMMEKYIGSPQIFYAGNHINGPHLELLGRLIRNNDVCVNVISKSGTTTEPAIAFRVIKKFMEEKYDAAEVKKRIFATTDREKGALKTLADEEGYETFVVPDDVGGRYSVLTAVGLLPIAVRGVDTDELLAGARDMMLETFDQNHPAVQYAAARTAHYRGGKKIEVLVGYDPTMHFFREWWKQLYGESEGKDGKGLFPASVDFTTDLHSMGQYLQEGERTMFETVIRYGSVPIDVTVPDDAADLDGLNYIAGKSLHEVNDAAIDATIAAHYEGGVPQIIVTAPEKNEYYIGQLIYMFELACGMSAYALGVNPFNQPGVENYKNRMFQILGKPGY